VRRRLTAVRRDAALRDLEGHAEYIAQDQPAAALRLIRQFDVIVDQLQRTPLLGRAYRPQSRRLRGIRMIPIAGFRNYLIFYRVDGVGVDVLRVLHVSQDCMRVLREEA
jgi:toxin ParE1/3/4